MSKVSRRDFFKAGAAAGAAAALPVGSTLAKKPDDDGAGSELTFVNGRIHTMDDRNRVVNAVAIRNGRFVSVGKCVAIPDRARTSSTCADAPWCPGSSRATRTSSASPTVPATTWRSGSLHRTSPKCWRCSRRAVATCPPGQFITAMGAGTPRMFAELRLPTLAELDAAVPDRPVFLYQGGGGPGAHQHARQAVLRERDRRRSPARASSAPTARSPPSAGVNHGQPRALPPARPPDLRGQEAQRARRDGVSRRSVGVTANLDQTLVAVATGTLDPASLDPQPTHALVQSQPLPHVRRVARAARARAGRSFGCR